MTQPLGAGVRILTGAVAVLTGLTGLTLFALPQVAGGSLWPWQLTPLVARYLGALFIGVAVGAVLTARAVSWAQVRLLFPPALTFTGLSLVAAWLHVGSFNPARLATWAFFGLYLLVFVAGLVTTCATSAVTGKAPGGAGQALPSRSEQPAGRANLPARPAR